MSTLTQAFEVQQRSVDMGGKCIEKTLGKVTTFLQIYRAK